MRRRLSRRAAVALLLAAASCGEEYKYFGVPLNPSVDVPSVALVRGDGSAFDLGKERGKASLVFFGYTNCPDVCPTTLADWKRVRSALKDDAGQVRFVFITIDPQRDSPAITDQYVARFDSSFVGLSGDTAKLAEMARAFGVSAFVDGTGDTAHYGMAHPSRVYLVDPQGRIRFVYPPGLKPEEIAQDILQIL